MLRRFVQLEGFIRAEPPAALAALNTAFGEAGGYILGAQAFSNVALSASFELPAVRLPALRGCLERAGIVLFDASEQALASAASDASDADGDANGQLLVTLIHDQPDKPGVVPAVPG